jgi:hypothetical protein
MGPYTNYIESSPTIAFIDACTIPGHTVILDDEDDATASVTLPFEFRFYDYLGTSAWASSNGVVGFGGSPSTAYSNSCLPTTPRDTILPYWDDLFTTSAGVCVGTLGAAPNRVQVITWSGTGFWSGSGSLTFSVMLNEGTNIVDIAYQTLSGGGTGASATVGVQGDSNAHFTQHSCNTAGLTSGTSIRYTPM